MIVTMTVQGTESELPKMKKAMDILGAGTLSVQAEFRGNGEVKEDVDDEADKATAGKRVARPRKVKEADDEISNQQLLTEVQAFCDKHSKLIPNVTSLLKEYGAERVSQVPLPMRTEFLSQMHGLSTLT